jgi:SAM-dependent methyltransferase
MKRNLRDYSDRYSNQPFEDYQVFYRKKHLLSIIDEFAPQNILEIGCGLETIGIDLINFENLHVVEPSIKFYKKLISDVESHANIYTHNCLIEDFKINFNFDFIIVSSLLHEIEDLGVFFQKLKSISSKETILYFNMPNSNSFHRVLALHMGLISDLKEFSVSNIKYQTQRVFNIKDLEKTMSENGFQILDKGSYFIKPFTHTQMQCMIDKNIIDQGVLEGLNNLSKSLPDFGSEIFITVKLNS